MPISLNQVDLPPPLGTSNAEYNAYPATSNDPNYSIGNSTLAGATLFPLSSGATGSAPAGTSTPNTAAANPVGTSAITPPATASSISPGSLADYFARGIIVVLGFIFIAIGLNMLKPGLVPMPTRIT